MRAARQSSLTTRRNFLHHCVTLAGAATLPTGAAATPPNAAVRFAQAAALAGTAASAITVKSTGLVGSAINYAYAVKAGPWVFLNGHEAFDFERGLAPEVEGQPGNHLSGARGGLPAAPHARSSQGIWHRSAKRGAGRPVLHHGGGGIGLSLGALRRIR